MISLEYYIKQSPKTQALWVLLWRSENRKIYISALNSRKALSVYFLNAHKNALVSVYSTSAWGCVCWARGVFISQFRHQDIHRQNKTRRFALR